MTLSRFLIAATILMAFTSGSATAQTQDYGAVLQRLQTLEELVRSLDKRVADLSAVLRSSLPPAPIPSLPQLKLDLSTAAITGADDAQIVVIEYSDFECPFCGRHAMTTLPELQRELIATGRIRYVFRHLPLEQLHPAARKAAEAAECALDQGRFWGMHDRLFESQRALSISKFIEHAGREQLNIASFQACLLENKMAARVNEQVLEARRFGITGTPTFLIGELQTNGIVQPVLKLTGVQSLQAFRVALERITGTLNGKP